MDKRDSDSPKIFDGDKFSQWRFRMEICLGDKGVMRVVNDTIPKPPDTATDEDKLT